MYPLNITNQPENKTKAYLKKQKKNDFKTCNFNI